MKSHFFDHFSWIFAVSLLMCALSLGAQQKSVSKSPKAKTQTTAKRTTTAAKPKAKTAAKSGKSASRSYKGQANKRQNVGKNAYSNAQIKGLQSQRAGIQRKIREQERLLRANREDVKKRLSNLMALNSDIERHQETINGIERDITSLDGDISLLKEQLNTLDRELQQKKAEYIKSMRYMAKHRSIQEQIMFIFSGKDLAQVFRRMRFVREYAAMQRAQGEKVKQKQSQITAKHTELRNVRGEKNNLLNKGKREQGELQNKQTEQQTVVASLKKQEKTIQSLISEQKKKDAQINAQIDRLIAQEVAKAKARAEAEAKRKAEAAEKARKQRALELERKKREAEEAARVNAERVARAKALEEKAKAEARQAAQRSKAEKDKAEQAARQAEAERKAAEMKAEVDKGRREREIAKAKQENQTFATVSSQDRALNGRFESNRGHLPMPITGGYRVVSHFGQYTVEGLKNVTLDNKGINILGSPGAQARSIFNGEVSAVFGFGGQMVVMVRHGNYISVYCNLSSVNVHRGQQVATRQALGTVGGDNILQFQLRHGTQKLNPEAWLQR